jgi:hypothetical protein
MKSSIVVGWPMPIYTTSSGWSIPLQNRTKALFILPFRGPNVWLTDSSFVKIFHLLVVTLLLAAETTLEVRYGAGDLLGRNGAGTRS